MKWVRKLGFKTLRMELLIACDLAIQCGEAMLATAGASAKLKDGQGGIDPQTKTDLTNERLVMDTLAATFPDHDLIGEETAAAAGKVPAVDPSRPTWIVDPIDGTQNFCHSLPVAAVSIGLCVDGKPAMGVIYDPYRGLLFYPRFIFRTRISLCLIPLVLLCVPDELYVGVASEGAYLNGARIQSSGFCTELTQAMVLTDVGYERSQKGAQRLAACHEALLNANTFGVRIIGSTVLALGMACRRPLLRCLHGRLQEGLPKSVGLVRAWAIGMASGVSFSYASTAEEGSWRRTHSISPLLRSLRPGARPREAVEEGTLQGARAGAGPIAAALAAEEPHGLPEWQERLAQEERAREEWVGKR